MASATSSSVNSNTPIPALGEQRKLSDLFIPYREFRRFNISSPEEASLFLLAEEHSDQRSQDAQAALINFLAATGHVIVLHEGLGSGEILENEFKDNLFQVRNLHSFYKNNITVVGWDASEEVIRSMGTPEHVLIRISENVLELEKKSRSLFEEMNVLAPGILKDRLEIKVELNVFMSLDQQKCDLIRKLILELANTNSDILNGMQKYNQLRKNPIQQGMIDQVFPKRTEAMISCLQQLEKIKGGVGAKDAKVVLIAGAKHLKTDREDVNNSNYDLSSLYHELENYRSVILIPHHIWD